MTDVARKDDEQRKANVRLALILASVALVLFLGFIAKMVLLEH
ncbi:MAG TPA: cytochrome oxidase small assembly protein [Ramlibacter sp.]|nr:cytochrome oxidase small assembly protein [Ramlibacter sp.]HET8744530.1 cytochrome oxidase small assembly protein [Ramlibacter sp.]